MSRPYYGVFFDGYGSQVAPSLLSKHWTLEGAKRAFKRRNPHLFNRGYCNGAYRNAGTFDRIFYVDESGDYNRKNDLA